MSAGVFRHQHRVTYADCTVGNHVYYARYLDLLEAARGELFRSIGQPFLRWQHEDTVLPVVECRLLYKAAACYDDLLTIQVWLTAIERVRLEFASVVIRQSGQGILRAATTHVCTTILGKPKRLPELLRRALLPYLHTADA